MNKAERFIVDLRAPCACGAVELAVHGPVLSMLICTCRDCQRATGSGHADVAIVPSGSLNLTGTAKSFTRPSDSGAQLTRHFCPQCGTPLFGQSSRAPDLRMLSVGFFVEQNSWFAPGQVIFARSRQAWDLLADHLPQHQTYREDSQP